MSKAKLSFQNFKNARAFARTLNIKSREEWLNYSKSGKKPKDIPATPYLVYETKGWVSWGDWLGTGYIAANKRVFTPFKAARKYARSLKLGGFTQWRSYCKQDRRPLDIPSNPSVVYKNKGWISWSDWLGANNIAPQNRIFLTFRKARTFVRSLKITSQAQWKQYSKSGNRPINIPAAPHKVYRDKGWVSWGDWFGNGNIATQYINNPQKHQF